MAARGSAKKKVTLNSTQGTFLGVQKNQQMRNHHLRSREHSGQAALVEVEVVFDSEVQAELFMNH